MPTVIYLPPTMTGGGGGGVTLQGVTPGVADVGSFNVSGTGIATILKADTFELDIANGDVFLTRRTAAALCLGQADAAAPVAQSLSVQGVVAGTANTAGAQWLIEGSRSTGSAAGGSIAIETTYPGAAGNAQNTLSMRTFLASGWTTLAEGAATGIATVTFGASSAVSAEFLVTIHAQDAGGDFQSLTSKIRLSSVRKAAGNTISSISLVGTDTLAESTGASTLTSTFTITEGAAAVTLNANATSSLVQTVFQATFQAIANGPNVAIAQL